jgi:hypothetical protein
VVFAVDVGWVASGALPVAGVDAWGAEWPALAAVAFAVVVAPVAVEALPVSVFAATGAEWMALPAAAFAVVAAPVAVTDVPTASVGNAAEAGPALATANATAGAATAGTKYLVCMELLQLGRTWCVRCA